MKKLLCFIAVITMLIPSIVCARSIDLSWSAGYSPPGGDVIVGSKIGRWVLDSQIKYTDRWVRFSVGLQAYGVTNWQRPEVRGHGWDKFTSDYAWQVDGWRFATNQRLEIGKPELYLFFYNYMPIDRANWDGHGNLTEYWYMVGVGGTWEIWSDR